MECPICGKPADESKRFWKWCFCSDEHQTLAIERLAKFLESVLQESETYKDITLVTNLIWKA